MSRRQAALAAFLRSPGSDLEPGGAWDIGTAVIGARVARNRVPLPPPAKGAGAGEPADPPHRRPRLGLADRSELIELIEEHSDQLATANATIADLQRRLNRLEEIELSDTKAARAVSRLKASRE